MSNSPSAAIEARQLTKVFGFGTTRVEALRGLDLVVATGDFVAVMGPSGSGKSTLLHVIAGLDPPTSGQVLVGGEDIGQLSDDQLTVLRRRKIGFIFQAFNLLDVLSAEENVALPLVIDGVAESEAQRRARVTLDQVGMAHRAQHRPSELSGGEQQRVAIARALVTEPVVLMADEPTGNLDSANGDQVMQLLRGLVDRGQQTIFMVTHDAQHATLADRLILLRDGRIVDEKRQRGKSDARVLADMEQT